MLFSNSYTGFDSDPPAAPLAFFKLKVKNSQKINALVGDGCWRGLYITPSSYGSVCLRDGDYKGDNCPALVMRPPPLTPQLLSLGSCCDEETLLGYC